MNELCVGGTHGLESHVRITRNFTQSTVTPQTRTDVASCISERDRGTFGKKDSKHHFDFDQEHVNQQKKNVYCLSFWKSHLFI